MKTQISRHSHEPRKRYTGVFQQQGRMLTDADWNELVHILNERITAAVRDVTGGGVPRGRPMAVYRDSTTGEPVLYPGVAHVGGQVVQSEGSYRYTYQPLLPNAPGPAVDGDLLYLDVWEREVLPHQDPSLVDPGLHGADTCSRTQLVFQLKRCPQATAFPPPSMGDAMLELHLRASRAGSGETAGMSPGNFVFRVEVHDVQGDPRNPTRLTLKWSTENASEVYGNDYRLPEHFKANDWLYEFHNSTTELHLGVQLVTGPGFPARGQLERGYPASPPTQSAYGWVRRWDGMCELMRSAAGDWSLVSGWDRGAALTAVTTEPARHGDLRISATGELLILLQELDLRLPLKWTPPAGATTSRIFMAGDSWLATVREDDAPGTRVLQPTGAIGVMHHYLKLGTYRGTRIDAEPHLQFPTLTELVRSTAGASGDMLIGSEARAGTPRSLEEGTVGSQLKKLIDFLNEHVQATRGDHDNRYYTEAESDSRFAAAGHHHDGRYVTSITAGAGLTGGIPSGGSGSLAIDTTVVPRLGAANTFTAANTFSNVANAFTGNGANLSSLNASNLSSGTVASARLSGAYGGITGVGTLNGLGVTGDVEGAHGLMKRLTLGASVINASFQGTVDTQSNGIINKGDGYLELRTNAFVNAYAEVRSNSGPYIWGSQLRGSFLSVLANLSWVHQNGQVAYITHGAPKGSGQNSGGYGFKVIHNGVNRILYGVIHGMDGAERGSLVIDANMPQGQVRLFAVHRGNDIEFFRNGVSAGLLSATNMMSDTFPLYCVRLENNGSAQAAQVAFTFLTIGTPVFF
jgi:hypothetical protein